MRGLLRLLAITTCVWAMQAQAADETFDNQGVIALHAAGLDDEVIMAKVKSLPCNYDLSTEKLVALKRAGIAQDVIVAMIDKCRGAMRAQGIDKNSGDPLTAHAPGIYMLESWAKPARLDLLRPSAAAGVKLTGNGSILFPHKATLTVPQAQARSVAATSRPTFYFYFNTAERKADNFGAVTSIAAQSPNEFSLVRFRVDKNTRQFVIGRAEPYVEVVGIDPRNALPFEVEEVGDGIFRIEFPADLAPGEYGFVLPGEKSRFRIYDFSVSASAG